MSTLLQSLAKDTELRPTLFQNKLNRTVALHRRFSGPRATEEVCGLTTDFSLSVIGSVNSENRTYVRVPANATMEDFVEEDGKLAGISDMELMGLVIGIVAGFSAHPDTVLFVGVDNMNAM